MADSGSGEPDQTAVRVALWRALHVLADPPPHVLEDEVGLRLAAPDDGWRHRQDMDLAFTSGFRAHVVARSRFIEDLVAEQAARGVDQYVLLGAGLDTFAQRRPDVASRLRVFEVDQPRPQAWKRRRLTELGYGVPDWLRLVPVDFEAGGSWRDEIAAAGFDAARPAVVASAGVSMYLTREANAATMRDLASLAPGSTVALTFQLPAALVDERDRRGRQLAVDGASRSGTPFISFFTPAEMLALAREAGFTDARHVSGAALNERYFGGRGDGLRMSTGEDFLVAAT
jgi:methyltransferase (TIGR00027 family)